MAAPTEVYIDPAIAADSGTGTIGDPFGDVQYALNTATRDATNGNRFNIKAGTAEVLAAQLSLTTYGTPTADAPLVLQGYTSAAGDGGIGDLNGNAGNFSIVPAVQFIICRHLTIRNSGTATLVPWSGADWNILDGCELRDCANTSRAVQGAQIRVHNCNFSGGWAAGAFILEVVGSTVIGNFFNVDAAVVAAVTSAVADRMLIERNIFICGAVSSAMIRTNNQRGGWIRHNSILGVGATGRGIFLDGAGADGVNVLGNVIEGFSGAGGDGIEVAAGAHLGLYAHNAFYNNADHETGVSGAVFADVGDNEVLASTPFAKSGAATYANRATYFAPLDVGNVWGGAYPTDLRLDKGAVQHAASAGGGLLRPVGLGGGLT